MKIWPYSVCKTIVAVILSFSFAHTVGCKNVQADGLIGIQAQCCQGTSFEVGAGNDNPGDDIFTGEEAEAENEDGNCQASANTFAQVPQLKQLVDTKIAAAQQVSAETQIAISQLRKKLNDDGLDANERELIQEDIDWKQDLSNLVEKMINRLAKCRIRIETAEMMIADFDQVQKVIDTKFLAEVDATIQDLDRLLHRSQHNV